MENCLNINHNSKNFIVASNFKEILTKQKSLQTRTIFIYIYRQEQYENYVEKLEYAI